MITRFAKLAAAAALLCATPAIVAAATRTPVVVELFTSEGCSSCPPADAYLGELTKSADIIALSFHVDYWDYIGWKDPFASPQLTDRQRKYTTALGNRFLYTPEIVVDGREDATGSDRDSVGKLIRDQQATGRKVAVTIQERGEHKYTIRIPDSSFQAGATVWMAFFDKTHKTAVAHGENGGRTLEEYNIVREFKALGRYDGKAAEIPLDMALTSENGCAILVQSDYRPGDGQGAIVGAALYLGD
jgi:hypothetical protein